MIKLLIDDSEVFEVMWFGFNFQDGEGYAGARLNQIVHILDALDEVSEPVQPDLNILRSVLNASAIDGAPPQQVTAEIVRLASSMHAGRRLKSDGGEMELREEDFKLLKEKLEKVPWTIAAARKARHAIDFLIKSGGQ